MNAYLAAHAPALVAAPVGLSAAQYHTYMMCKDALEKIGLTISPAFVFGEELWVCVRNPEGRDRQVADVDRAGRLTCVCADAPHGVFAALRALPPAVVGRRGKTIREASEAAQRAYIEAVEAGEEGRIESAERCAIGAICFELGRARPEDTLAWVESKANTAFAEAMAGKSVPLIGAELSTCWLAFTVAVERNTL